MTSFEELCQKDLPDLVVVVGDVNSTLACSIVAKKLLIRVAHVEAGLRSFDMSMPEEINRIVTDSISDYFFVTEQSGVENLVKEGKPGDRIHFVGHVMIDNLFHQLGELERGDGSIEFSTSRLKEKYSEYAFLTMHRPANVDSKDCFAEIAGALNIIAQDCPIFFPVHPRTRKMIGEHGIELSDNIIQLPPLPFSESLYLWKDAAIVLTDSGGLQEEGAVPDIEGKYRAADHASSRFECFGRHQERIDSQCLREMHEGGPWFVFSPSQMGWKGIGKDTRYSRELVVSLAAGT
jgi:UDP-N-acetylglucosamine 2-epimerase (non-hydrolysing)